MKRLTREILGFNIVWFSFLTCLDTIGSEVYSSSMLSFITLVLGLWILFAGEEDGSR